MERISAASTMILVEKGGAVYMAVVTKHGRRRMYDRVGITKGNSDKMAKKVLDKGIRHSETKGELNRWMDGIYLKKENANNMRFYSGKLYLFNGGTLITVFDVPQNILDCLEDNLEQEAYEYYTKLQQEKGKTKKKEERDKNRELICSINRYAEEHGDRFIAVSVSYRYKNGIVVNYVSDNKKSDWSDFVHIISWIKGRFGLTAYLTHIKGIDRKYVTIEEYNQLKKKGIV